MAGREDWQIVAFTRMQCQQQEEPPIALQVLHSRRERCENGPHPAAKCARPFERCAGLDLESLFIESFYHAIPLCSVRVAGVNRGTSCRRSATETEHRRDPC